MNFIFLCSVLFAITYVDAAEMTHKQLASAAKLIRNVCQSKTKVTNGQITAIHEGRFTDDPLIMCYMECVLRTSKLMKGAKYDLDSAMKQLPTIPADLREATKISSVNCKDSATSSDLCRAAYEIYTCILNDNPTNFFLA